MTDYTATPEQWADTEHWAYQRNGQTQACILELRARVETLEAAAHKHILETNSNILALFSRVESLEAAERQASKVYQISKPLRLTAEQQAELQALLTPNFRVGMTPTSTSNQVDSSLVDRVARAIGRDDEPINWEEEARAALAEQPVRHTPIPMAERLPCLEDCDEQGRCWFHSTGRAWCDWYLLKAASATDTETHWLPANALPIPESP